MTPVNTLKTATFGTLFGVTFAVSATFQMTMIVVGLLVAVLAPTSFTMNGQQATNVGQAVGALVTMFVVGMIFNAMISSAGAGLWLLVRRLVFKRESPASVF